MDTTLWPSRHFMCKNYHKGAFSAVQWRRPYSKDSTVLDYTDILLYQFTAKNDSQNLIWNIGKSGTCKKSEIQKQHPCNHTIAITYLCRLHSWWVWSTCTRRLGDNREICPSHNVALLNHQLIFVEIHHLMNSWSHFSKIFVLATSRWWEHQLQCKSNF